MTRVLLAEDDPAISEPLARALRREGYEVEVHADGGEALTAGQDPARQPDIVVLDLGLPTLDGLEVCRRLRASGATVPVLILTARADEVDTVVGLDAGADDYVTKPFRLAELLARVRALLRRQAPEAPPAAEEIQVDEKGRRAWFKGEELHLTTKEFEVLRVLVREEGNVVTREDLMREVWDTAWIGSTKTLDMHVSVLRRKLGEDAAQPRYISTVRGHGFRFNGSQAPPRAADVDSSDAAGSGRDSSRETDRDADRETDPESAPDAPAPADASGGTEDASSDPTSPAW